MVRHALQPARGEAPRSARERKSAALDFAAAHAFPTGDIDAMNAEIERGHAGEARR